MNIDIRKYVISNFEGDSISDIRSSIDQVITSREEEPLIGLGVLFELLWNNSDEETKLLILSSIKKEL